MRSGPVATDVDAYISASPPEVQERLTTIRAIIAKAAPAATETISYGMPTFRLHGNLLHFAAFTRHIGLYPGPDAITAHAAQLAGYVTSKGAIQLPLDRPLPVALIRSIATLCVKQSVARDALRRATVSAAKKTAVKKAPAKKAPAKKAPAGKTAAKKRAR